MEQKTKSVSPLSNANRNAYVTEQLTSALLALLEKKSVGEISISELCGIAGVGRTSFYRNYETKEDILKARIEQLFQSWMIAYQREPGLPLDKLIHRVFSHLEVNRDFYGLLHKRGLTYLMKDILLDLCGFEPDQEAVPAYSSAYAAFFLYGWIETWLRRGMRETTEELAGYLKGAE